MTEHSHGDSAPHEHEGDAPGHTHDAPTTGTAPVAAAPVAAAPVATAPVDVGPSAGGLSARIILTIIGAALMIAGAFMSWFNFGDILGGTEGPANAGVNLKLAVLYSTDNPFEANFFASVGFIAIVLGLLALLGLALNTGWLTRLAGVLAIIEVVAYGITLFRVPEAESQAGGFSLSNIGIGAWMVLAGGLVVLIGGFLGSRRVVSAPVPPA